MTTRTDEHFHWLHNHLMEVYERNQDTLDEGVKCEVMKRLFKVVDAIEPSKFKGKPDVTYEDMERWKDTKQHDYDLMVDHNGRPRW